MNWLLWRELLVMTRTPALWIAMAVQAIGLTILIVIWADGIPVLSGSFFSQFSLVHFAWSLIALPWVCVRCSIGPMRNFGVIAAAAAVAPRAVVLARTLALLLVSLATVVSALPLTIVALRIADGGAASAISALFDAAALSAFVAAVVTASIVSGITRFLVWILTTGCATLLVALIPAAVLTSTLIALALIVGGVGVWLADSQLRWVAPPVWSATWNAR